MLVFIAMSILFASWQPPKWRFDFSHRHLYLTFIKKLLFFVCITWQDFNTLDAKHFN